MVNGLTYREFKELRRTLKALEGIGVSEKDMEAVSGLSDAVSELKAASEAVQALVSVLDRKVDDLAKRVEDLEAFRSDAIRESHTISDNASKPLSTQEIISRAFNQPVEEFYPNGKGAMNGN